MLMHDSPQIKSRLTLESFYHKPHSFNEASAATSEPNKNAITRLLQVATDDGSIEVTSAHYVVPEGNTCYCMTLPEDDLGFEEGCSRVPAAGVIQFEYSDGSCYEMIFDDTEMYAGCDYNGVSMGDSVPCYEDLSDVGTTENSESESDGGTMKGDEDSATVTAVTYLAPAEGDCNCIEVGDDYTVIDDTCADDVTWGQVQAEYSDSTCYTLEFNNRDLYANCEYTSQRSGDSQLCSFDLTEDSASTTETPTTRAPSTQSPPGVIVADTQAPDGKGSDSQAKTNSAQATQLSAGRLLAVTTVALLLLH